jgi:UDP-N-acetylglucosamine:LPS N-acetylglucosamine transferase
MNSKLSKIIIATGGTGGHVFPAYSLAKHFIDKKIGRVELACETKENECVFSVTYDYLRINTAYPSETYDSFNLIESSASIGVGLNIAKKIISYYGGKLYKKTVPNKETIFSFNFPKTNTYA